jgi:DNA-binding PadR family transcriptional regulator
VSSRSPSGVGLDPSQGYQLRARLEPALGPLGEGINAGQIYVTVGRPEKAGLVTREESSTARGERKAYLLTRPARSGSTSG